jgi:hypothetical protein
LRVSCDFQVTLGWHHFDLKKARALFVLSGLSGIVELSHWLLASICIHLKSNFVVFELPVEWTTTVIEQLAHLYFKFLASTCSVIDLNKCRPTHPRKTKPKSIKYPANERNDFAENVFDPSCSGQACNLSIRCEPDLFSVWF